MYRGTTPTLSIRSNSDLTGWTVEVDVKGPSALITKTGNDVTITADTRGCIVSTTLTQADTLSLSADNTAKVQLRAIKDGVAIASSIAALSVEDILRDGTIGGA